MYLSQLKNSLSKDGLKPIYLIYGNNEFEFREALGLLKARMAGEGDADMAIMELSRDERDLATVMDLLHTSPMFASKRMVIMQQADEFVNRHRKAMENYVNQPSETGVLVLTMDKWNRTTRLAKAVAKLGGDISCWAPRTSGEVMSWISSRARSAHNKKIDLPAAELLMNLCQEDLASLESELTKLELYVGDSPQITEADVMAGAMSYRADNPFDLAERLMDGDLPGALRVVDGMMNEGMPAVALVGILRSSFRRLLQVRLLADRDGEAAAVRSITYPKEREMIGGRLARYSSNRVRRGYRALLEADVQAKSTGSNDRLIIEQLSMKLLPDAATTRPAGR